MNGVAFVRRATLHVLAEIGVLVLLFDVGLEADLRALVRVGPSASLVAVIGVVMPFALGWGTARWLVPDAPPLAHLFVGATLTATSVGITARVLKDLGSLQSREGQVILGAAILDDILGLVVLAAMSGLVTAMASGGSGLSGIAFTGIILKAVAFLGLTVGLGHYLSGSIMRLAARMSQPDMHPGGRAGDLLRVGVRCRADRPRGHRRCVRGRIAAGPLRRGGAHRRTRGDAHETAGAHLQRVCAAVFRADGHSGGSWSAFATVESVAFGGLLVLVARSSASSRAPRESSDVESTGSRLGLGWSRGARSGLIFTGIGAALTLDGHPLLSQATFSALVLMVVVTTLLTPIGLRWALQRTKRS